MHLIWSPLKREVFKNPQARTRLQIMILHAKSALFSYVVLKMYDYRIGFVKWAMKGWSFTEV